MGTWTLDTIDWGRFDASKVDPEILRNIKAAAMVERNGGDYGIYLGRVFADDQPFVEDVRRWAGEEIQHQGGADHQRQPRSEAAVVLTDGSETGELLTDRTHASSVPPAPDVRSSTDAAPPMLTCRARR